MTELQKELIRELIASGISESVLVAVGSVLKADEIAADMIDRLANLEEDGVEINDTSVTAVLMDMIHEAFETISQKG